MVTQRQFPDVPPQASPPAGMSYQWITAPWSECFDSAEDAHMRQQGWCLVPADRHPEMPSREGVIAFHGAILVERAVELSQDALREDAERAIDEVRQIKMQLPDGSTMTEDGPSEPPFREGDEIWDRRSGTQVGVVVCTMDGYQSLEIRTSGGVLISIGSGGRASPFVDYPKIEDMVTSRAEAMDAIMERMKRAAEAIASSPEELADLIEWASPKPTSSN